MRKRKYLFPREGVLELNYQAGRKLGVNVYVIDGGDEFALIDIGYLDAVDEIIDLLRALDFKLSQCKLLIATHADADHVQGLARAKEVFKAKVAAHPLAQAPLETGDEIMTFARIDAQDIRLPMPPCKVDVLLEDGDVIEVGDKRLTVWHT
ncbi:MAG TPA: MBL fold metallo-hydrolase, partial [Gemmatales bacterium]|nr:MBL fold metallo-hydrolase [Gemmatales bacterium]